MKSLTTSIVLHGERTENMSLSSVQPENQSIRGTWTINSQECLQQHSQCTMHTHSPPKSCLLISTTNLDACVCVCSKFDQFLPVRSQFDSNQHVNSVRIATFQSANFGPLLFAFYCPLFFYENKIKNE